MAIEITIPRLGWSMDEGTFGRWLKQDGEQVEEGDALFELEGDKAVQAVESFDAGILRILPNGPAPGDTVRVGDRLAYLCQPGESVPLETFANSTSATSSTSTPLSSSPPGAAPPSSSVLPKKTSTHATANGDGRGAPVTPSARRLARELGVDLEQLHITGPRLTAADVRAAAGGAMNDSKAIAARQLLRVSPRAARAAAAFGVNLAEVTATGASGRIRERDILAVAAGQPTTESSTAPRASEASTSGASLTSLRQTIATRMLAAAQQTASVTLTATADAASLVLLRSQSKASKNGPALSYTDMFVKLSAAGLGRHPALAQQWTEQGLVTPSSLDIAVAVDTPHGLLTPVLRDVAALPLSEISLRLADLIARARVRRLNSKEMCGGVFTVTNLGGYRVDAFTPLLNLPQTAILGVGRIAPQPTVVDGQVAVRDRVTLSLTFDHRVVDGAAAAALLTTLCELVENPLPALVT